MKENKKYILLLFVISLVFYCLVFFSGYYKGHDYSFHYYQISDYVERIDANHLVPSQISKTLANSFGYGSSLFYPPFMHLLTAYIVKLSPMNVNMGINFVNFLSFFLSSITMYFLAKRLFNNNKVSFFASIIYMLFTYHIADIFVRSSYAESWIFVFFPMILSGLIELSRGNYKRFYTLFIVGYVFSIYSHYLSIFYLTFLLIPFFIFYFKDIFEKKKILALFLTAILILMISSPLIVSIFEHRLLGDYRVFHADIMTTNISFHNSILSFSDLFLSLNSGWSRGVPVFVGYEIWILLFAVLFYRKKLDSSFKKERRFLLVMSTITIFLLCFKFIWDTLPIFQMIQFVWRLLILLAVTFSLLAALSLLVIDKKYHVVLIVFCIIYGFIININIINSSPKLDSEYRYSLGFQSEYLPTSCPVTYIQERNNGILILEGDAFIDILKDDVPNLVFQVNKIDEEVVLELPRIYYLGYVLKDEQGNSIFLEESEYGFLKATLSKEGKYTLSYEGTNYRNYSKVCAFIGIMLFILNLCYCKRESVNKG